ncbi:plexin-A4-like [Ruditapes philippinarum]|uniref:plexin-A4-like n=1 Tax=Ruditapes philippinarum TaxID=129788 RepID=UPI00295C2871|nr:plexin-A4-like [Ruditapes philippinarum]
MLSTSIFYHLCAFILPSGLTSYTRIQQTEQLSAPLTSFWLYEENFYVGGVNRIYALDKDLKQIQIANTCESTFGVCSRNVNKILLVHQSEQFHVLVSCGTGNSGVCEARNLSNIESVLWSSSANYKAYDHLTVSTNENRPAVGLITSNGTFFVAVTFGDGIHFFEKTLLDGRKASTYSFAISARKLYHFKPIRHGFKEKLLRIQIPSTPNEDFLIYYKACFQYNGMSYFVTNQKNEVGSSAYVTKLVRICQNDTHFNTYTDIVLNCNHFDVTYNLIQDAILVDSEMFQDNSAGVLFIAVFTRGNNPEKPSGDSVGCISKITDIDDALDTAQLLYSTSCTGPGNVSTRYLPSYKKVGECQKNKDIFEYLNHGCNTPKKYSNVLSKDPINIEANFVSPNISGTLTTLAGATYENKTVIWIGTTAGIILQTVLLQNYSVLENYKMTVDPGNEIRKIYAIGEETVYVMSSKKVVKYATTNCSEFESCEDVIQGKHPLCGWCVYKERATRRHACSNYTDHWISSFENCLSMSVAPHAVPLSVASNSSNTKVIVRIKKFSLRDLDNVYLCMFSMHSNNYMTNADDLDNTTFSCSLPMFAVHGDVKIELLVKTQTGFEASLSSASILIYDCRQYKRCMECINTKFVQCNWCGQDASCQEPKSGCPSPISIIGECPQLLNNKGNFLPLGTRSVLTFRIANPINSTGVIYRCMLHASESVMATLNGDFLSCRMQVSQIRHGKKKEKLKIIITYGTGIDSLAKIDDLYANSGKHQLLQ